MELNGVTTLYAGPDQVRAVLRDRETMARLLPASRELVAAGQGRFEGVLTLGVPPLAARYPVRVAVDESETCIQLRVSGTGRAEGMWLRADCELEPGAAAGSTRMTYHLAAEVGSLGRLIGDAAGARLIAGFLDGLRRELTGA